MVTLRDVAKRAGVSVATASYALNNSNKIKEETRKLVADAAKELGYIPNALAKGLSSKRSGTIGLLTTEIELHFDVLLIQAITKYLKENGYNLLLGFHSRDIEEERRVIENFRQNRVDGVISFATFQDDVNVKGEKLSHFSDLRRAGIPLVFINGYYSDLRASYVIPDLEEGYYKLTCHLLDKGYSDFKMFSGQGRPTTRDTHNRVTGCWRAFGERGLKRPENMVIDCAGYDFASAYKAASAWLSSNPLPHAILAFNDFMALGILRALREKGLKVPEDVALCGCDDVEYSVITDIMLTTIQIPIDEMCRKAVEILVSDIKKHHGSIQRIMIEPTLVIRQST